jgi:tetratricopeptide (TPR) repeat protein
MQTIHYQVAKRVMLFFAAVTLFAACSPPGSRALLQGQRLLEQGKYPQAVEKLREAATLLGNTNAHAFNYLGLACHYVGQFADAEKAYQRALALNQDLTEVHYNFGCLLLSENKPDQAKAELTAYTLRRASSAEGWLKLGAAELRLSTSASGNARSTGLAAAEKSFTEALHLSPQNPEALNGLGLIRLHRNRVNEATNLFSRALAEQPDYPPALLNLAIVAQKNLNDPQLALQRYREYLSLNPLSEDAEAIRKIVYQLQEQHAPGTRLIASNNVVGQIQTNTNSGKPPPPEITHLTASPKSAETNVAHAAGAPKSELTNSPLKPGLITNAPKSVASSNSPPSPGLEIVKLAPEPVLMPAEDVSLSAPEGLERNSNVEPRTTKPSAVGGASTAKRSLLQRLNPLHLFGSDGKPSSAPTPPPSSASNIAQEPDAADEFGTADRTSARYVYLSPPTPAPGNRTEAERVFAQGVQAQHAQQLADAIQAYQRTIDLDPSFYEAHYNLALAASEAGNLTSALSAYETALAVRPESVDARYNFALTLKQSNYFIDAANEFKKVLAAYPNEGRAHLALGNLYAQQFHEPAKARQEYLKVLELDPHNPQADAIRYWLTHTR